MPSISAYLSGKGSPNFIKIKATIEGALTSAVYLSDGYAHRFFESGGVAEKDRVDKLIDSLKASLRAGSLGIDGKRKTLSLSVGTKTCAMELRFDNVRRHVHCFPQHLCLSHLERIEEIQAERASGNMSDERARMLIRNVYEDVRVCNNCFAAHTVQ